MHFMHPPCIAVLFAEMLAAARGAVRRRGTSAAKISANVPLPVAMLERCRGAEGQPKEVDNGRDGTLWTGYASGWIYDGRKGFYEHQPGFLNARARC